jgi:hypothetical protein
MEGGACGCMCMVLEPGADRVGKCEGFPFDKVVVVVQCKYVRGLEMCGIKGYLWRHDMRDWRCMYVLSCGFFVKESKLFIHHLFPICKRCFLI